MSRSISKVLSVIDDPYALENWRHRVGREKADAISKRSANIGSMMHNLLEHWIQTNCDCVFDSWDPTEEGKLARKMAEKVYKYGLKHMLEKAWNKEVNIKYKDYYHGRLDLSGIYNHEPCVIDFKQSNGPKKREWCWKYMCQLAAYIVAHNHTFPDKPKIKKGVILMCSQSLHLQMFELKGLELLKAWNHFKKAVRFCEENNINEVTPDKFEMISNFRKSIGL